MRHVPRLTLWQLRLKLLQACGLDGAIILPFNAALAG